MNEYIWLIAIISLCIVVGLLIFFVLRKQDVSFIEVASSWFAGKVKTRESGAVTLSGFTQEGENNSADINRGSVHIENTKQKGKGHQIKVNPDNAPR